MRALIATEKGEEDPWDLKLAAGGLTDLDFLAQFLVLASCQRPSRSLLARDRLVFAAAREARAAARSRPMRTALGEAHPLFTAIVPALAALHGRGGPSIRGRAAARPAADRDRRSACPTPRCCAADLDETRARVRADLLCRLDAMADLPGRRLEAGQCTRLGGAPAVRSPSSGQMHHHDRADAARASGCAASRHAARTASGRSRGRGRSPCGCLRELALDLLEGPAELAERLPRDADAGVLDKDVERIAAPAACGPRSGRLRA